MKNAYLEAAQVINALKKHTRVSTGIKLGSSTHHSICRKLRGRVPGFRFMNGMDGVIYFRDSKFKNDKSEQGADSGRDQEMQ